MEEKALIQTEESNAIRGIRVNFGDDKIFWFRDDLHNPYPISPLGMSTVQKGHM